VLNSVHALIARKYTVLVTPKLKHEVHRGRVVKWLVMKNCAGFFLRYFSGKFGFPNIEVMVEVTNWHNSIIFVMSSRFTSFSIVYAHANLYNN